ncbi:hypothetical protein C8Q76DRAFT_708343 [Earliella scabrosa]|nr:hypothetical protein C8Q76DRAFT_708343 [Earliella scabrosa]
MPPPSPTPRSRPSSQSTRRRRRPSTSTSTPSRTALRSRSQTRPSFRATCARSPSTSPRSFKATALLWPRARTTGACSSRRTQTMAANCASTRASRAQSASMRRARLRAYARFGRGYVYESLAIPALAKLVWSSAQAWPRSPISMMYMLTQSLPLVGDCGVCRVQCFHTCTTVQQRRSVERPGRRLQPHLEPVHIRQQQGRVLHRGQPKRIPVAVPPGHAGPEARLPADPDLLNLDGEACSCTSRSHRHM